MCAIRRVSLFAFAACLVAGAVAQTPLGGSMLGVGSAQAADTILSPIEFASVPANLRSGPAPYAWQNELGSQVQLAYHDGTIVMPITNDLAD
jgi:hypothetical protein